MREIDHRLVIGDIRTAGAEAAYEERDIEVVVCVTSQCPRSGYPNGVTVYAHPMADGPRNRYEDFVDGAARVLHLLRESDYTVLVHCTMGASRSVGVAAAALAVHRGGSVDELIERLGPDERSPTEKISAHACKFVTAVRDSSAGRKS